MEAAGPGSAAPGRPVPWRYVVDDRVSASFGLAADETLTRRQGGGQSPPTVRLYTYRSHCALVGRFQRVSAELDLEFCARQGVEVNRRPTGGGAIVMGADQLGVAVMVPERRTPDAYQRARELFLRFSGGLVRALAALGVAAEFRRKNDLEVRGRKVAGLGIYFDPAGGLLFHASLLVDLDVPFMLRVLRTPFAKISDKEVATVAGRITTVRRETGREVAVAEVRDRVREGYQAALGVDLREGPLLPDERREIAALEEARYRTPAWVGQDPATTDLAGAASIKTEGGLVSVHLTLAGDAIKALYVTGDFFCDEGVLAGIERALRWHPAAAEAVARTLAGLAERDGLAIPRVAPAALAEVVACAADNARAGAREAAARGCFVPS